MAASIARREQNEKLVELVRKVPAIYDASLEQHKDAGYNVFNAWESITREMGVEGMNGKRAWF